MIYILLADGFEEIEALTPLDYLKRADLDVLTVGVTGNLVTGCHNVKIVPDIIIDQLNIFNIDMLILPGGIDGTRNIENSNKAKKLIKDSFTNSKVGAICAAPIILGHMGLLKDRYATCFPGFEKELFGSTIVDKNVVHDGNLITAKGVGVSQEFSFELIKILTSKNKMMEIKNRVQYHGN